MPEIQQPLLPCPTTPLGESLRRAFLALLKVEAKKTTAPYWLAQLQNTNDSRVTELDIFHGPPEMAAGAHEGRSSTNHARSIGE